MIAHRILDNDMGAVEKRPLTGVGTIHGITMTLDIDSVRVVLPEFPMSILEMLSSDMGITKVKDHCEEQLGNEAQEAKFVEAYKKWATPINASGKVRY